MLGRAVSKGSYKLGLILIAAAISISLVLFGCTGGNLANNGQDEKLNYVVQNQLEIVEKSYPGGNGASAYGQYKKIQIKGLENAKIQDEINRRLSEMFEWSISSAPPPYRGVLATIEEGEKPTNLYANMYVSVSANNVLSVTATKSLDYRVGGDKSGGPVLFTSELETLNVDLTTGNEITLSDLLGKDWEKISNDHISKYLSKNNTQEEISGEGSYIDGYGMAQVAPFKGIKPTQKFYVQDGGVQFVLDYNTPEFDLNNQNYLINMPYPEGTVLTNKFFDEGKNIYTAKASWVKNFAGNYTEDSDMIQNNKNFEQGNITVNTNSMYSRNFAPEVIKYIKEKEKEPNKEIISEMTEVIKEIQNSQGRLPDNRYYSQEIYGSMVGDYTNILIFTSSLVRSNNAELEAEYSKNTTELLAFKKGKTEPLKITDIFKEPKKAENILAKAAVESSLKLNTVESEGKRVAINDNEAERYQNIQKNLKAAEGEAKEILKNINGITIESSGIRLSIDRTESSEANKYFRDYELDFILYEYLGCDNLNIFE